MYASGFTAESQRSTYHLTAFLIHPEPALTKTKYPLRISTTILTYTKRLSFKRNWLLSKTSLGFLGKIAFRQSRKSTGVRQLLHYTVFLTPSEVDQGPPKGSESFAAIVTHPRSLQHNRLGFKRTNLNDPGSWQRWKRTLPPPARPAFTTILTSPKNICICRAPVHCKFNPLKG